MDTLSLITCIFVLYLIYQDKQFIKIVNKYTNKYLNPHERDSTDPPDGRSGLIVYTDNATGVQYVSTSSGEITPRLNLDGTLYKGE